MYHIDMRFNNLDRVNEKDNISIYNTPIRKQFELLQARYAYFRKFDDIEEFLYVINNRERIFHISIPNFERIKESRNGRTFLNHVVIRTVLEEQVLFRKNLILNVLFIGTIAYSDGFDAGYFEVRGLDILDQNINTTGEKQCTAMTWIRAGENNLKPSMSTENLLSKAFVQDIIDNYYTVKNVDLVRNTYNKWNQYLDFVSDYLQKQKKENYLISDIVRFDAYAISKQEYIERKEECEKLVLDNDFTDRFRKRDEIVLTGKIGEAYDFPLIRVAVDRLKKDFAGDFERNLGTYKKTLSRFTNENVCASIKLPETLDDKEYSQVVSNSLQLGDRYAMLDPIEIEPDYQDIELQSQRDKKKASEEIKLRYADARKALVNREETIRRTELSQESQTELDQFVSKLNEDDEDFQVKVTRYESLLKSNLQKKLMAYADQIRKDFDKNHAEEMAEEIAQREMEIDATTAKIREQWKQEKTILRTYLYFKAETNDEIDADLKYLLYDDTASKRKVIRAREALKQFYKGNVKNPFLVNYLFDPASLVPAENIDEDLNWFITRLNPEQKMAVKRAFRSNGLFLLQGPPGTGKTEVIAEMVAQFTSAGKKVLVSSETHKAIDNVFKRIPKSANIRPIRLITSRKQNEEKKQVREIEYGPKKLVDNFYSGITANMKDALENHSRFEEESNAFEGNLKMLSEETALYANSVEKYRRINEKRIRIQTSLQDLSMQKAALTTELDQWKEKLALLQNTRNAISNNRFRDSDMDAGVDETIIREYLSILTKELEKNTDFLNTSDAIYMILSTGTKVVTDMVDRMDSGNTDYLSIKTQLGELDKKIMAVFMSNADFATMSMLRNQKAELENKLNQGTQIETPLSKVFSPNALLQKKAQLVSLFDLMRTALFEIRKERIARIDESVSDIRKLKESCQSSVESILLELARLESESQAEATNPFIMEFEQRERKLKLEIERLFALSEIPLQYESFEEALIKLKNEWLKRKSEERRRLKKFEQFQPLYAKVVRYLSDADVIEQDRKRYTQPLFEAGNMFGLTCTSNDRFSSSNNDDMKNLGLEEINIKRVGIDVVIIDEVSKSSLLELLIPILYGKTIILVGDHRQLPPMYEYKYLKEKDFEGLDPSVSTMEKNRMYQEMYETSFFKLLFEQTNPAFKVTLLRQYRSHEHIMNVFNHFYQGQLKLGNEGQNREKEHHLRIVKNGYDLITPDKHVYFVDCHEKESGDFTETTSCSNPREVEVASQLVRMIQNAVNNNTKLDGNAKKPSIGVISTYGDQAKHIKKKINWIFNSPSFDQSSEQRPIVSTVDDFQGDERDIIIVSMVRNPRDPSRSKAEFIRAFERINVAYSRARKMLVILGAKDYLSAYGKIDLPDMYGDVKKNRFGVPIFQQIIGTIAEHGRILNDTDFVKPEEFNHAKR